MGLGALLQQPFVPADADARVAPHRQSINNEFANFKAFFDNILHCTRTLFSVPCYSLEASATPTYKVLLLCCYEYTYIIFCIFVTNILNFPDF